MKRGFTLVELLIVMVILSFGLVTMLLMLKSASRNNADAHFVTVAGKLAEGMIERVIGERKTQGFAYIANASYPSENPVADFPGYTRSVNVYYINLSNLNTAASSATNYKRVDVAVAPSNPGSDFPPVAISTVVTSH